MHAEEDHAGEDHDKCADGQHQEITSSVARESKVANQSECESAEAESAQREGSRRASVVRPIGGRDLDGARKGRTTSHACQETEEAQGSHTHRTRAFVVSGP